MKTLSKASIKKLIFISTCSNYGISNKVVNEKSKLKPLSVYAKNKVMIERFLLNKKNFYNYPIVILRFATAFGWSPRMRFDLTINQTGESHLIIFQDSITGLDIGVIGPVLGGLGLAIIYLYYIIHILYMYI